MFKKSADILSIAVNKSIERFANSNGVSVECIRSDMNTAILHVAEKGTPQQKRLLAEISHSNDIPTPEEVIVWIIKNLSA